MPSNVLTYLNGPFMNAVLALLRRFFLLYSAPRSDVSCECSSSQISARPLSSPSGACIHRRVICLSSVLNFLILNSLRLHFTSFIRLLPVFFTPNISFPIICNIVGSVSSLSLIGPFNTTSKVLTESSWNTFYLWSLIADQFTLSLAGISDEGGTSMLGTLRFLALLCSSSVSPDISSAL